MRKKEYSLMLVLALVSGLVGGVVSIQFLRGQSAFAEKKTEPPKVIEAQGFDWWMKKGILKVNCLSRNMAFRI